MPFLCKASNRLYYRIDGRSDRPLLVLGNSLGTDVFMWDRQMDAFTAHFRVLRMDTRGHGASDVMAGEARIDDLGRDVLDVVDALQVRHFYFCGVSLGAMVGQWLGIHAPDRVRRLVLSNASAHLPSHESWSQRMELVRRHGMTALTEAVMPRFFSQRYRDRDEPFFHSMRTSFEATPAEGYAACCAAVRDADFRPDVKKISVPTLIIAGEFDAATPPDPHAKLLHESIPGARLALLPTGHISNVEHPEAFNRAVLEFLND